MRDLDRPRTLTSTSRALDPMEELIAAVVNLAINDGLKKGWYGAEARHWVRTNLGRRFPDEMNRIERFWDYPFCRCGKPYGHGFAWPEVMCPACRMRVETRERRAVQREERRGW